MGSPTCCNTAVPATSPRTTRAEDCAARLQRQHQQPQLLDDALQLVFERLPLEEQVFTVGALIRAWRRRAQPQQLQLQERRRRLELAGSMAYRRQPPYCRLSSVYTVPLWLCQTVWLALTVVQRGNLLCRAARRGDGNLLCRPARLDDVNTLRLMGEQHRKQPISVLGDPQRTIVGAAPALRLDR